MPAFRRAGVAGLDELREASIELGVRMIACEAGLRAEGIDPGSLLGSVEVAGVATFLAAVGRRAGYFVIKTVSGHSTSSWPPVWRPSTTSAPPLKTWMAGRTLP